MHEKCPDSESNSESEEKAVADESPCSQFFVGAEASAIYREVQGVGTNHSGIECGQKQRRDDRDVAQRKASQ